MNVTGPDAPIIAVRGNGAEALFAAAVLARMAARTVKVVHLVTDAPADVPPALCIPPTLLPLLRSVDIDTAALMRAADGTFHLGTTYVNGHRRSVVADGPLPAALPPVRITQLLWDLSPELRRDFAAHLTLNVAGARLGTVPPPDDNALQHIPFGLHLRTSGFLDMVGGAARHFGLLTVTEEEARCGTSDAQETFLIDGQPARIAMMIDARTDPAATHSWHISDVEAANLSCASVEQHTDYLRVTIPLQRCTVACDVLSRKPHPHAEPAAERNATGMIRLFADSPIDPHPDRHWRALAVILPFLRERLSVTLNPDIIVRSFNALQADLTENQQDVAALGARLLGTHANSSRLERRTEQFLHRGRVVRFDAEAMSETELLGFLMANDIWPQHGDLLASQIPRAQREAHVKAHISAIERRANSFIRQHDFLERAGLYSEARDGK